MSSDIDCDNTRDPVRNYHSPHPKHWLIQNHLESNLNEYPGHTEKQLGAQCRSGATNHALREPLGSTPSPSVAAPPSIVSSVKQHEEIERFHQGSVEAIMCHGLHRVVVLC